VVSDGIHEGGDVPRSLAGLLALLVVGGAMAQSSSAFRLEEHSFNAGGRPQQGTTPQSEGGVG
jgi:hypothetical protein